MAIPKKPAKNPENFIMEAKADTVSISKEESKKPKKFLIEMDYELWLSLKMMALKQNKPLKDLIVDILKQETLKQG